MRILILALALFGSVTGFAEQNTDKYDFACKVAGYYDPKGEAHFADYSYGRLTVAADGEKAWVALGRSGVTSKLLSLTGPHITVSQDDASGYSLLSGYSAYSDELTIDLVNKTAKYSFYFTHGGHGTGKDQLVHSIDFTDCK